MKLKPRNCFRASKIPKRFSEDGSDINQTSVVYLTGTFPKNLSKLVVKEEIERKTKAKVAYNCSKEEEITHIIVPGCSEKTKVSQKIAKNNYINIICLHKMKIEGLDFTIAEKPEKVEVEKRKKLL
jgi:hypothetical protein